MNVKMYYRFEDYQVYIFHLIIKKLLQNLLKKNNRKSATLIFVISLIAIKTQKYIMYCRLKKLNENNRVLRRISNLINYASELRLKYKTLILLIFCPIAKKRNCLHLYYTCKTFTEKRSTSRPQRCHQIRYVNGQSGDPYRQLPSTYFDSCILFGLFIYIQHVHICSTTP